MWRNTIDRGNSPMVQRLRPRRSPHRDVFGRSNHRLVIERLEDRWMLAGDIMQVGHFYTWNGEIPSTDVAGITYHPDTNRFYLADSEINELGEPTFRGYNIFVSTLDGHFEGQEFQSNNTEPTGITFNHRDGYFYVTNDDKKTITKYDEDFNFIFDTKTTDDVPSATDPEGITSDPDGRLYVVDGEGGARQVLVYNTLNDAITYERSFSVAALVQDCEGIAYYEDGLTKRLFIVSDPDQGVFEFELDGTFVKFYDLRGFRNPDGQRPKSAQGLTFAPTTRQDLYPGAMALYIADGMQDNYPDGQVFEAIINGGGIPGVVNARVSASSDDANEIKSSGLMELTSGDIDLGEKITGLRFAGLDIPQGATILDAFVQFQVDSSLDANSPQSGSLTIFGENTANPATFTTATGNIATRPKTTASLEWFPSLWSTSGEAGLDQRTPSLVSIIQEIVNTAGASATDALALIITGSGKFEAESFDGIASAAPLLHVEFAVGNQPPQVDDQLFTVDENSANGTAVGTVVATDPDAGDVLSYSITAGNTGGAFAIDLATGQITVANQAALDFETTPTFALTVQVQDTALLSDTATVTINLNDLNEATVIFEKRIAASSDDADEKTSSGQMDLTSGDLDMGQKSAGLRFTGVDIPQGATIFDAYVQFQVDGWQDRDSPQPGELTIHGENSPNASTFTTDPGNITSRSNTTASVSWSPPLWSTPGEAGPDQRTPSLAAILQEIVNGAGWAATNAMVLIVTGTGKFEAESFDGIASAAPLLHVEYTAGTGNHAPTDIALSGTTVAENADGVVIGDITVTDPDAGDTHTLTVSDPRFEIVSGQLKLKAGQSLDHESEPTVSLDITATDSGNLTRTETFIVTVTDVNEAPVANNDSATTSKDTAVTIPVLANDSDEDGDSLNATIVNQPANGLAAVNPDGTVTYTPAADFTGSDSFTYRASDGTLESNVATVSINVTPLANQAPADIVLSAATVTENEVGAVIGTVTVTDPDPGDTHTLTVSDPRFEIVAAELKLKAGQSLDYESEPTVSLDITATDSGNLSLTETFLITVTDVNEPPATGPHLAHGVVNVGSSWQTVTLSDAYSSMVVIATPNYDSNSPPAVTRIRNAAGNSFEIRVDPAGPNPVTSVNVHYLVVESGVYDEAGFKMEAVTFTSTVTDENNSWLGQSRSYLQPYSNPVVLGQVMSYNDPDWSVFWAGGSTRKEPPSSTALTVGKHVGEDADVTRADETIGYIVIETSTSGTAQIEGLRYVAAVGDATIGGVDGKPPYSYSYAAMPNSKTALVSQAGMDGTNGGWAILYGDDPITSTGNTLKLAIEEDQTADLERSHAAERVAYLIIDPPAVEETSASLSGEFTTFGGWAVGSPHNSDGPAHSASFPSSPPLAGERHRGKRQAADTYRSSLAVLDAVFNLPGDEERRQARGRQTVDADQAWLAALDAAFRLSGDEDWRQGELEESGNDWGAAVRPDLEIHLHDRG